MRLNRNMTRGAGVVAIAALLGASVAACDGLKQDDAPPALIGSYLSAVEVPGIDGETVEIVNEQLGAGADGPVASVDAEATVVNGGSIQQTVTSDTPFSVVRIALEELTTPAPASGSDDPAPAPTSTGAPARGYQQITLAEPATETTLLLTLSQGLPHDRFLLYFATVDAEGTQGPLATQDVQAVGVGTGDVQVSVSWDVDSDLDLHVVDPNGEVVYWWTETSESGGKLDLDSNSSCVIDSVRNENITWPSGTAPAGTYTVRLHLYSSCDVEPTKYVVTVHVAGQPTRTYSGTITGPGDESTDESAGEVITTFEVTGAATTD